jgi:DNA-binding NarL/FixJ family response regulator
LGKENSKVWLKGVYIIMSINLPDNEYRNLTNIESDIIRLATDGLTNIEIAQKLSFSVITIKKYLTRIYSKLGLEGKRQLIIYALKNNL